MNVLFSPCKNPNKGRTTSSVNCDVSDIIKSMLTSIHDKAGKGCFWESRAHSFVEMITDLAFYNAHHSNGSLDADDFYDLLNLKTLCKTYFDPKLPTALKSSLKSYLYTFSEIKDDKTIKRFADRIFTPKALKEHNYVSMQLEPSLRPYCENLA